MSKLLGFREWVTLPDAAAYLTHELSEPVREADVVRLGLDCRRRSNIDPPCRSNIDPGMEADRVVVGCGQV